MAVEWPVARVAEFGARHGGYGGHSNRPATPIAWPSPPARDPPQPPRLSAVAARAPRRPPQPPGHPRPAAPAATPTAGHPRSAMPDAPSLVIVAEFLRLGPSFRGDDHRMASRAGRVAGARPAAPGGHPNR